MSNTTRELLKISPPWNALVRRALASASRAAYALDAPITTGLIWYGRALRSHGAMAKRRDHVNLTNDPGDRRMCFRRGLGHSSEGQVSC